MTTMITELYEALKEAGTSDEKAKAAAEAIADYERSFARIESKLDSLTVKFDSELKIVKGKMDVVETKFDSELKIIKGKMDVAETKFDSEIKIVKGKMDVAETKFDSEIKIVKAEISVLKWMLGFVIAGIVSMIIKLFI